MTNSAAAALTSAATPSAVIVDIDRPSENCPSCTLKEGLVSETKPSELSSVPNFLWDELKDALNPILRKYNSIRLVITSTVAVSVLAYVSFILLGTYNELEVEKDYNDYDQSKDYYDDDDDDDDDDRIFNSYEFIIYFLILSYIGLVIGLQLSKTRNIRVIVSKFLPRFASNGVHIRFETINTGPCKNKREIEVRRLVFTPAATTTTTTTSVPVAVAPNATANITTATTPTPASVVADVESPSPQFSSAPVYTTAANQGQFGTTTTTTTTSTMFDDNQPSVVDQMMADLNRPL